MAKSKNQKLKLIYLMELLWQQTDEEHAVSMRQIIEYVENRGICAERKSIYDDLEVLKNAGWEIGYRREHPAGYYLKQHVFDHQDLCMLVDSIRSSYLITDRKSKKLVEKIKSLCSQWEAQNLEGKIQVAGRIKTISESLSFPIQDIQKAIFMNRKISFHYTGFEKGENSSIDIKVQSYHVSPWEIVLNDAEYELIAYADGKIRKFCISYMKYIRITSEVREGEEVFSGFNGYGR